MSRIIHILNADKFFVDYIHFLENNIPKFKVEHQIFITGEHENFKFPHLDNVIFIGSSFTQQIYFYVKLIIAAFYSEKIIFHGLFNLIIIRIFCFFPISGQKMFWAILGGDLYNFRNRHKITWWRHEIFRIILIKKIRNRITYLIGDHELADQIYGTHAKLYHCIMYPSNVVPSASRAARSKLDKNVVVLLGNSATKSNRHVMLLNKIEKILVTNVEVICPLSYGDKVYAKKIEKYGVAKLGECFKPLRTYLPLKEYMELLDEIDIAMMGHDRSQAMGNILNLIARGKKVYMDDNITSFRYFENLGVTIFNLKDITFDPISKDDREKNIKRLSEIHSLDRLIEQWEQIFR